MACESIPLGSESRVLLTKAMRLAIKSLRANHTRNESDARRTAEKSKKAKQDKEAVELKAEKRRHEELARQLKTKGDIFGITVTDCQKLFTVVDEFGREGGWTMPWGVERSTRVQELLTPSSTASKDAKSLAENMGKWQKQFVGAAKERGRVLALLPPNLGLPAVENYIDSIIKKDDRLEFDPNGPNGSLSNEARLLQKSMAAAFCFGVVGGLASLSYGPSDKNLAKICVFGGGNARIFMARLCDIKAYLEKTPTQTAQSQA